ncbi:MAG: hypothetical protein IJO71_08885 [Microbacterium sp.]|nr:hypothetical protein [Microbacterium sp.]MBQ9917299.1 hypothetical protein [Microbacterium sp.]
MSPDPIVMEYIGRDRERQRLAVAARQEQLHRAAVARRRKAKRGGRR